MLNIFHITPPDYYNRLFSELQKINCISFPCNPTKTILYYKNEKSIIFVALISILVTVQPFISEIHKPASKLSVAAMQLMFISFQKFINLPASCQSLLCSLCLFHFRNERLFYHKKILNNTMNKFIVLPIIFLWLNCYPYFYKNEVLYDFRLLQNFLLCGKI